MRCCFLKFLRQILLIFLFSFLGELLRSLIPLPIPASIYGMVLLFVALSLKIVKLEDIKSAGGFLTSLFPLLFVAPVVSLMDCWADIAPKLVSILFLLIISTLVCFFVAGRFTQRLMKGKEENHD